MTGAGLPASTANAALDVVEIDHGRLAATASGRLEDALRDVAGLQQFRRSDARSANPTSQGVTLRGLGGNAASRALVLLDGVPQGDPFGGYVSWPLYAPGLLGGVRVTRGGGSGALGPGALAGTIELESVGARDAPGVALSLLGGSRESIEASGAASGSLGGGFAIVGGSYAKGDGFVPIVAEQRGAVDKGARYTQASLAARAAIPLGNARELQASMALFDDRRTRGTDFSANATRGADASLRLVERRFTASAYGQLREFRSQFASVDTARSTVTPTLDQYNTPAAGIGARFEARPDIGSGVELRLGSDWRRTSGSTNEFFSFVAGQPTRLREAGGRADTLGAFAEATLVSGALTLTGGARVDRWWITEGRLIERSLAGAVLTDSRFTHRNGWQGTGRTGIAWAVDAQLTLRAAGYLGWRLPTLNELYRPFRLGPDATAANAALSPERSRGLEAGLDWRPAAQARLSATVFANRLDDAIANVTIARGPGVFPGVGFVSAAGVFRQRRNLDAIDARGLEIEASAREGDWRLAASYAFTDARVRASGVAAPLDGLRPAQVARHLASATLGWKGLAVTGRFAAPQFEDDQNTRRLRDAFTLDAVASLPLGEGLALILRAENIVDARVEAGVSAAGVVERASPRTLWAGLSWRR